MDNVCLIARDQIRENRLGISLGVVRSYQEIVGSTKVENARAYDSAQMLRQIGGGSK